MAIDRAKVQKEAEKLLAANKVDRAIEEFRKILDDNPKDLALMNRVGDLCIQAGRVSEAIDIFKRLATGYERDGFHAKGTAILRKAVRSAPDDIDLAQRLADLYRQTGMIKDAVAVHLQVAEQFNKKGLIKRALEEFTKVVELDPKNLKMKVKLADIHVKEGMKERAAAIYLEVAESLAIEQMHGEAAAILERAKSMVSTPMVFLTQSRLCVIQKDLDGAATHLREGLAANPRSTEILEALAEVELQARAPERALEAISQIPQMPEKALALCERALRDMVKAGRTDEGLALFKQVGRELARRGMGEAATRILRNALHGNLNSEAWIQLAEIAHQGGNRNDHVLALQNAYALAQRQEDATLEAWILERLTELGASPGQGTGQAGPSTGPRQGTQPIPVLAPLDGPLPGTETAFTDLDPIRRMQIEQLEREAESHLRNRTGDRAVEALKRILDLDPANEAAIERIAEVHRSSGLLTKVQLHYVNTAAQLAELGKRQLAVKLLDQAEALFPGSTRMQRRILGLLEPAAPVAPAAPPSRVSPTGPIPILEPIALGSGTPEPPPAEPEPEDFDALIPLDTDEEPAGPMPGTQPIPVVERVERAVPPPPEALEVPALPAAELDWADVEGLPALETEAEVLEEELPPAGPGLAGMGLSPDLAPLAEPLPTYMGALDDLLAIPEPAAPAAPPVAVGVDDELASTLSDIDFQLDYGSPEEAKIEIENGLRTWPDHPELLNRLQTAEEALRKLGHEPAAGALAKPAEAEHSFFDLTDVLGDVLMEQGEGEEMHDATRVVEKVQSVEELFNAFREGVEQQVKSDDYDTHYNLGIAYKEMMLMEPAVEEFKKAMVDPERTLECCSMLSICEQAVGNMDGAVAWLLQGIDTPGFPPEDAIGLRYDLGEIYLHLGRNNEAGEQFQRVYDMDPEYREVALRV